MADYLISKAAVQKMLLDLRDSLREPFAGVGVNMALHKLEGFSPADAVEVVRCKDCENAKDCLASTKHYHCDYWDMVTTANGFCHAGKKKGGAKE